jgi:hypothetical protein
MQPIESDQWDDTEILRRLDNSEGVSPDAPHVKKIGDDTLVKATRDMGAPHLEASSFEFVRMHTTIPIPHVRRRMKDENGDTLIVMDYIPGERLDHIWPSLSLSSKYVGVVCCVLCKVQRVAPLRTRKESETP